MYKTIDCADLVLISASKRRKKISKKKKIRKFVKIPQNKSKCHALVLIRAYSWLTLIYP